MFVTSTGAELAKVDSLSESGISMDIGEQLLAGVADIRTRLVAVERWVHGQEAKDHDVRVALLERTQQDLQRRVDALEGQASKAKERLDRTPLAPNHPDGLMPSKSFLQIAKESAPITLPVGGMLALFEAVRVALTYLAE